MEKEKKVFVGTPPSFLSSKDYEYYLRIGAFLRKHRKSAGFTLRNVSDKFDLSQQQIQKYEIAQTRVPVDMLDKLCDFYRADIGLLFKHNFSKFSSRELYFADCLRKLDESTGLAVIQLVEQLLQDKDLREKSKELIEIKPKGINARNYHLNNSD